jgi:hypothetical protein
LLSESTPGSRGVRPYSADSGRTSVAPAGSPDSYVRSRTRCGFIGRAHPRRHVN